MFKIFETFGELIAPTNRNVAAATKRVRSDRLCELLHQPYHRKYNCTGPWLYGYEVICHKCDRVIKDTVHMV